ncbi:DivIVA domain-containing protein [Agathobaculum sp. Marseille-P7918]|uniref:DivIVA domain-containing protein n=1 Tax=Agathobaculum sp. Marseille-P7918 TaxID=2479843 RepID=UPI000F63C7BD|nr:DivIVA domain-containing protein [Agathobaculum sp. Marseille-P7918]
MTVQEIQEIGFEKAVFGGYDMKSVDTFLERVAEEFAAMQKENAALKAKMKVLVDKIEEYRGVEDGMRRALMSAQTIAQDTIDKAKKEAQDIVSAAKDETENKVKNTRDEIELEEQKLEAAKKNTIEFIARVSAVYQAQAKALVELAKAEQLVRQQQEPAKPAAQPAEQQAPAQQPKQEEKADAPIEDATRKFDFGELKFGADYDPKEVK